MRFEIKKLSSNLALFGAILLFCAGISGQKKIPQFKDYAASDIYTGKIAPVKLKRDDLTFKTRLRWAAKNQKVNFAGRYILTTWGCGASCVMGAVIDAKTGRVYWWNFSVCCWSFNEDENFNPIEFRANSNLIVFSGLRNEKEGDNGAHFYKFENGRFIHILTVSKPDQ